MVEETGYYANEEKAFFVTPGGRVYVIVSADDDAATPHEVAELPKEVEWIQDGAEWPELVERVAKIAG